MNIIPKTGGNMFKGQAFGSGAGSWSQGNNIDDALEAFGILNPPTLHNAWDVSGSLGGPIEQDSAVVLCDNRDFGSAQDVAGLYLNAKWATRTSGLTCPIRTSPLEMPTSRTIFAGRVQAQITPRNKIGFYLDHQLNCDQSAYIQDAGNCRSAGTDWIATGGLFGGTFASPEAFTSYADTYQQVRQATWTSTVTAKLLLEAGFSSYVSRWGWMRPPGAITNLEQVTDFGRPAPPFQYRALDNFFNNYQSPNVWRASASYVTGAHNMKFGYQGAYLDRGD